MQLREVLFQMRIVWSSEQESWTAPVIQRHES